MEVESVVIGFPACKSTTRRATISRKVTDKTRHFQIWLLSDMASHLMSWAEAGQAECLLTLLPLGFGTVEFHGFLVYYIG